MELGQGQVTPEPTHVFSSASWAWARSSHPDINSNLITQQQALALATSKQTRPDKPNSLWILKDSPLSYVWALKHTFIHFPAAPAFLETHRCFTNGSSKTNTNSSQKIS